MVCDDDAGGNVLPPEIIGGTTRQGTAPPGGRLCLRQQGWGAEWRIRLRQRGVIVWVWPGLPGDGNLD